MRWSEISLRGLLNFGEGDIIKYMIKIKKGKNTITNDVAYIAGFFDGEGCIRIKRANQGGNSYYITATITNSNKMILEYIKDIFGGKVREAEKKANKVIYHYELTSSEAVDMIKTLLGFLKEKKEQAELAINFHEKKEWLSPQAKLRDYQLMSRLKK